MKRTGPTNAYMQELIRQLKKASMKEDAPIWKRVAEDLEKPTRQRRIINVYMLSKCAKDGETIVVPGKVLGAGDIERKIKVAAFTFSTQAAEKIKKVGGSVIAINDLMKENPKGKNVRIMG